MVSRLETTRNESRINPRSAPAYDWVVHWVGAHTPYPFNTSVRP